MIPILEKAQQIINYVPTFYSIIGVVVLYLVLTIITKIITNKLSKDAKTKRQKTNIEIFGKVMKYLSFILIILIIVLYYSESFAGIGFGLGILSAALGWALQKPIVGFAAWIMIIIKRPFEIGDRILIGDVGGDLIQMSLTHLYIKEIGGLVDSEERSGRTVMIPNSVLFEENIINYTFDDDFVLSEVATLITYESNLNNAIKIILIAAKKHVGIFTKDTKKDPYIRTFFKDSGISVIVRYMIPTQRINEFASNVTKEIYDNIVKTKNVEIAYPHTEVVFRKK